MKYICLNLLPLKRENIVVETKFAKAFKLVLIQKKSIDIQNTIF